MICSSVIDANEENMGSETSQDRDIISGQCPSTHEELLVKHISRVSISASDSRREVFLSNEDKLLDPPSKFGGSKLEIEEFTSDVQYSS